MKFLKRPEKYLSELLRYLCKSYTTAQQAYVPMEAEGGLSPAMDPEHASERTLIHLHTGAENYR